MKVGVLTFHWADNPGEWSDYNSRVESLPGLCGLGDRLLAPGVVDTARSLAFSEVDWNRVHITLAHERDRSIHFLREALHA